MSFSIYILSEKVTKLQIENTRVSGNFKNLSNGMNRITVADSLKAARIGILTLKVGELEEYNKNLKHGLKAMGIKIADVERISANGMESSYKIIEKLKDSIKYIQTNSGVDTVLFRYARYNDKWLSFYQEQIGDSIKTDIKTRDSIVIIQHWERYRFLFFRWGKKNSHETVINYNPHSEIKYAISINVN